MNYRYRAVKKFWKNFYKLRKEQKESVRRAWQIFKRDPFHPSLEPHEIHELSARAKHTIYARRSRVGLTGHISHRRFLGDDAGCRHA